MPDPKDEGTTILRNIGKYLQNDRTNIPQDLNLRITRFSSLPSLSVSTRANLKANALGRTVTAISNVFAFHLTRSCAKRRLGTPDYSFEIKEKRILRLRGTGGGPGGYIETDGSHVCSRGSIQKCGPHSVNECLSRQI